MDAAREEADHPEGRDTREKTEVQPEAEHPGRRYLQEDAVGPGIQGENGQSEGVWEKQPCFW